MWIVGKQEWDMPKAEKLYDARQYEFWFAGEIIK